MQTSEQRRAAILRRLVAADEAPENILQYTRFTMPDFKHNGDPRYSRYNVARVHNSIADVLHQLADGTLKNVIINIPPRHGKTELASKRFLPWLSGKYPDRSYIFGTYNETFAGDIGRAVRDTLQAPEHKLVFPNYELKDGSASAQRLETSLGGVITFVGRGGTITGRGGHGIVIDDPIKDRKEADSKLIRDHLWTWFTQVVNSRKMVEDAFVVIIQTRWHEDDLVGRLTDPTNPYYEPEEAAKWTVINLPALAMEDDPLGRKPGEALWPERFPVGFLRDQQRPDPRGFQALYQGQPSAADGNFFQAEHLHIYKPDELPTNLRYYAASDHAVSTEQRRDKTCLLPFGVDENDNIYILPDVHWRQMDSHTGVEAMLEIIKRRQPLYWYAERGQISKAIGPFLRKRMVETGTYCPIIEMTPAVDKETRAQAIRARMATGKVFFPSYATWWPDARNQLLKFPQSNQDDFVDALAYVGLGLIQQVSATAIRNAARKPKPGTLNWLKAQTRSSELQQKQQNSIAGW